MGVNHLRDANACDMKEVFHHFHFKTKNYKKELNYFSSCTQHIFNDDHHAWQWESRGRRKLRAKGDKKSLMRNCTRGKVYKVKDFLLDRISFSLRPFWSSLTEKEKTHNPSFVTSSTLSLCERLPFNFDFFLRSKEKVFLIDFFPLRFGREN